MEQGNFRLLGYPEEFYEKLVLAPDFFTDLNLDQVAEQIMQERKDYDLRKYFYRMPEQISMTKKRQEVLKAFGQPQLFEAAMRFSSYMQCARKYGAAYRAGGSELQQRKLLLDCGMQYVLAVKDLAQVLADIPQEGGEAGLLPAFARKLCDYAKQEQFKQFCEETTELTGAFEHMVFQVEFANRRLKVQPQEEAANYLDRLRALFPENEPSGQLARTGLENPFQGEKALAELELFVLTLCQKKYPESFERLRQYEQKYSVWEKQELSERSHAQEPEEKVRKAAFFEGWLLEAEQQLQVYLAMQLFMRKIAKAGYPLVYADFSGQPEEKGGAAVCKDDAECPLKLDACYDLALLLKQMFYGKPVVCNDAYYDKKERFLVVTGPNQGGKTTFARSLGQIVYFAKMGFVAPCAYARMPYFDGLLTHFSVEESLETGRGKLKEELMRLQPMMHQEQGRCFVILNELFTTAATYDAYIMGRRVMEHFMGRGCYGVYVTHIQELAHDGGEEMPEAAGVLAKEAASPAGMSGRIVSMAACVDEKDAHIRTYRIVRRRPEGVGYAYGLVEKYHLTYPELKIRIGERLKADGTGKRMEEGGCVCGKK